MTDGFQVRRGARTIKILCTSKKKMHRECSVEVKSGENTEVIVKKSLLNAGM